jgi:hypothetical protein
MDIGGLLIVLAIFAAGLLIGAVCGGLLVFLLMRYRQSPRGFDVITK